MRIQAASSFRLHWTCDEWKQAHDMVSKSIETGHEYVEIRVSPEQRAPVRFTFFWTAAGHWEGQDFQVGIDMGGSGCSSSTRPQRVLHNSVPIAGAASVLRV